MDGSVVDVNGFTGTHSFDDAGSDSNRRLKAKAALVEFDNSLGRFGSGDQSPLDQQSAGVLSSAIAAFFYIRVIVMMFFTDPEEDTVTVTIPSLYTNLTIWIAAIVTIALGVFPTPILDAIASLATFVR